MNVEEIGEIESSSRGASSQLKKKKKEKRKEKKYKKKKRKRKHKTSDSESENHKHLKSKKHKRFKKEKYDNAAEIHIDEICDAPGPSVPPELLDEQARCRAPMTKEEWEKSQSVIRRVYDETTGRTRLVKGDGEIIEEIVSRNRHREINKQATVGDGLYFQNHLQADHK